MEMRNEEGKEGQMVMLLTKKGNSVAEQGGGNRELRFKMPMHSASGKAEEGVAQSLGLRRDSGAGAVKFKVSIAQMYWNQGPE